MTTYARQRRPDTERPRFRPRRAGRLPPRLRRFVLTAHVVASVGWLGIDLVLLVFGVAGVTAGDPEVARAAYISMGLVGGVVIVPLSVAALITGVTLALGTPWGLVRYYWVFVKFVLTAGATVAVIFALRPKLAEAAGLALRSPDGGFPDAGAFGSLQVELIVAPSVALTILLSATILSVVKPWGRTSYGRRVARQARR